MAGPPPGWEPACWRLPADRAVRTVPLSQLTDAIVLAAEARGELWPLWPLWPLWQCV